ncbi:mitogen-activated protein kinase kinase kinase YODA-like isoform X2 [Cornus florida]|uniref:mitogen-activated protein kinase kinase kinase YODA-like isoform X2 n=1 Tax=Cornus florida TaxID=4283 RepID=UPI00289A99D4|nr:mitogen-activated protein kinase kinase kinase YODA-like isoform X2 [Cornus florida]
MPSWWGKFSSKEVKKKENKESFIDTLQRKFKNASEEKCNSRSVGSRRRSSDTISERGSGSHAETQSPLPSTQVSRCQSFAERPHAEPLPLPGVNLTRIGRTNSGTSVSIKPGFNRGSKPSMFLPLPRHGHDLNRPDLTDAEGNLASASVSSDNSIDIDDPSDSRLLSPQASDYENGNKTAMNSPSSIKRSNQAPVATQKYSKETLKPVNVLLNNQTLPVSPKHEPLSSHNLQITPHGKHYSDIALLGSGHCSSPGSGHNSGHNSVGGELSGQLFWQHSRCSPECSPIPSPRMTSPGPSSRIHSGAVTPLHPRAVGAVAEFSTNWPDDGKQQSHRLPLPPISTSISCPFSPSYSPATTPAVPRSPGRAENPTSPGSQWKKGRLLGRGTFGHVYLGFNSESGEMCAMKEVTLFLDDSKSKESAQQLVQEIALLSRLQHPNIVQYFGSETVDDKLYIYLEYVSGGSIYKILQDYGQLGEIAIRSYTKQILSGLAYLHAKNTLHRDIKGANILVDPNGRVKLADFGMAKHITGQNCPLSLKGSPYWMAPEVIRNSNGCNLAVDVWSLGCTVLEMATTKPPWSQYEGVAALFKIGNSKELPAIPAHLSDDGKDFVRQCLQRNPLHRPTAAQLLEHPFVKDAAPLERPVLNSEPPGAATASINAVRSPVVVSGIYTPKNQIHQILKSKDMDTRDIGHSRNLLYLDSGVPIHHSRDSKTGSGFSDAHMLKNVSCPVSPIGSPLLHSQLPQRMSGQMSPSPISSPLTRSGASTPLSGGTGAILFHQVKQPTTYFHEGIGKIPSSPNSPYTNGASPYQDIKPDLFRGMPQPSRAFQGIVSSENGFYGNRFGCPGHGDPRELYDEQSVLADRVSQQLLRDHVKLLDLNPSSHLLSRTIGI